MEHVVSAEGLDRLSKVGMEGDMDRVLRYPINTTANTNRFKNPTKEIQ